MNSVLTCPTTLPLLLFGTLPFLAQCTALGCQFIFHRAARVIFLKMQSYHVSLLFKKVLHTPSGQHSNSFTWHRLYFKICLLPVTQLYFHCTVTLSYLKLFINSILITPQQLTAVAPSCSFCLKGNNYIHLENFFCLFKTQLKCHLLSLCLGSLVSDANPFLFKIWFKSHEVQN